MTHSKTAYQTEQLLEKKRFDLMPSLDSDKMIPLRQNEVRYTKST